MLIVTLMHGEPQVRAWRVNGTASREVPIEVVPERMPWLAAVRRRRAPRFFGTGRAPRRTLWNSPVLSAQRAASGSEEVESAAARAGYVHAPERRAVIG